MSITISKSIAAAPEQVFERLTDFEHAAQRIKDITNIEVLTDGPVGVGTRFRETRMMFGKETTEEMEITRFEAPRLHTVEAKSCGAHYITDIEVSPEGIGSRVTMNMQVRPLTLTAKLMAPLGWLMSGMLKKCLEKDLDSIKSSFEDLTSAETA